MAAGVELSFDAATDARLRALWDRLADVEVPTLRDYTHRQHRPHISLFVADRLNRDQVRAAVAPMLREPLDVRLEYVGVFPSGVRWLGPVVTPPLLRLHARLHAAVEPIAENPWPYYRPASWVPHCTVAQRVTFEQLAVALPSCLAALPIVGRLTGAAVVEHRSDRAVYSPLSSAPS